MKEDLSFMEFFKLFPDEETCLNYIEKLRWENGIYCPFCGSQNVYKTNPKFHPFRCSICNKKFSHKVGTIFESSKIPLSTWFFLLYSEAINKKNISSRQMSRNLNLTQKTVWGMQHKIRKSLLQDNIKLKGIIEVDEVFLSKGSKFTRWGGMSTRKEPILGLIERGGRVVIKCIDDRKRDTVVTVIKTHVEKGSVIYTDGGSVYSKLPDMYSHEYVSHSSGEYVRGEVHTNSIENVWSLFKKSIRNAHHQISEKHIQLYCDQMAFKFNNRNLNGYEKFNKMIELCMNPSIIFRGSDKADKYYSQH